MVQAIDALMSNLNFAPNPHNFNPETSIPALTDKVIIVTGGNTGIGLPTVAHLSRHSPAKIYLACRSQEKFDSALAEIVALSPTAKDTIHYLHLDLSSFASIKSAAQTVLSENVRLDLLFNNAGLMGVLPTTTQEGYEIHFGVNFVGPALLTHLLVPLMQKTAAREDVERGSVRVINVSSGAYAVASSFKGKDGSGIDVSDKTIKSDGNGTHPFSLYAVSKLAQVWYAKEAAKRWGGEVLDDSTTSTSASTSAPTSDNATATGKGTGRVVSISLHPGRITSSNILRGFFEREKSWNLMKMLQKTYDNLVPNMTTDHGAWTQLWAGTAPLQGSVGNGGSACDKQTHGKSGGGAVVNGAFYTPVGLRQDVNNKRIGDGVASRRLWEWLEEEFRRNGIEV